MPDELLSHYLRGWFDGDGYFSFKPHKERFRITGNALSLDWYADALRRIGYTGHIGFERHEGKVWGKISVSGRLQVAAIVNLLRPCVGRSLARKWDLI